MVRGDAGARAPRPEGGARVSSARIKELAARELQAYRRVAESTERGTLEAVVKATEHMNQREIAEHVGWSQAKVSRVLRRAQRP
ncbi:putative RNA polymerase sigma-70 factor, SigBFG subfamily [Rhodococcus phage E3]|uniref:HTH DNA binding protein n=1 Tax=Rhodococcus phage E3 TaxID=1007869 RepID=UPI0002C6D61D|nr:HTH DNA binding protein [Rhodococcus phage E3]AEQ21050.1 putative RNA polymerase sigma-70 factor, SigBFG subfamily [Rhodococcus phage E3]